MGARLLPTSLSPKNPFDTAELRRQTQEAVLQALLPVLLQQKGKRIRCKHRLLRSRQVRNKKIRKGRQERLRPWWVSKRRWGSFEALLVVCELGLRENIQALLNRNMITVEEIQDFLALTPLPDFVEDRIRTGLQLYRTAPAKDRTLAQPAPATQPRHTRPQHLGDTAGTY